MSCLLSCATITVRCFVKTWCCEESNRQNLVVVVIQPHCESQVLPVGYGEDHMDGHVLQVERCEPVLRLQSWNDEGKHYHPLNLRW